MFWLDGDNALIQKSQLMVSEISKSRVLIEHLGLGFWLCGFAVLLAFRATRNGLWQPKFPRKWATLSFTFWLPFVLMISLVHSDIGLIEYDINKEEYKSQLRGLSAFGPYRASDDVKDRLCANAPNITNKTSLFLIREWKRSEDGKNRLFNDSRYKKTIKDMFFYHSGLWITMHALFILAIVQMFRKRIDGVISLIISVSLVVCTSGMYYYLHKIIYYRGDPSSDIMTVFVGFGAYLAIIATLGMAGEQFYFWTNRSDRRAKQENLQPLDTLE